MTARENLARHLGEASKLAVEQDAPDYWAFIARELVEVAGWRPPARQVSAVEELDALPAESVIVGSDGAVWRRKDDHNVQTHWRGTHGGRATHHLLSSMDAPLTVIHEGGA